MLLSGAVGGLQIPFAAYPGAQMCPRAYVVGRRNRRHRGASGNCRFQMVVLGRHQRGMLCW